MNLRAVTIWTTGITFFLTSLLPAWLICVTGEPALTFIIASLFWFFSSAPSLVSLGIACCLKSDRSLKVILGATIVYVLLYIIGLSLFFTGLTEDGTWLVVVGILFLPTMIPVWIIALVLNVPPRKRKYAYIAILLTTVSLVIIVLTIVSVRYIQVAVLIDGLVLQHEYWVNTAIFSPDGKTVVTASRDGTACIWDANTGQKLHTLEGHETDVCSAVFSPDGKKIVTGGNGTVKIWDAKSGKELHVLDVEQEKTWYRVFVALSPDGKKIITAVNDSFSIWDSDTGEKLQSLEKPTRLSAFLAFSPESKKIVMSSDDSFLSSDANGKLRETKKHTIHIFDTDSGKRMQTLGGHTDWVRVAAFSSNGKEFITASDDETVRIWDTNSGENLQTLRGLTGWVLFVAFLPDDKKIIAVGDDGIFRIWDADSGELLPRLGNTFSKKSRLQQAALSPDGKKIAAAKSNGTVEVLDIESGSIVQTFGRTRWFFTYSFESLAFSSDGKRIVTASEDGTARIWTLE